MLDIKRKYITDRRNRKIAVRLRIKDFEKMEEVIENYGLFKLMQNEADEKSLNLSEAKVYYRKLKKAK